LYYTNLLNNCVDLFLGYITTPPIAQFFVFCWQRGAKWCTYISLGFWSL